MNRQYPYLTERTTVAPIMNVSIDEFLTFARIRDNLEQQEEADTDAIIRSAYEMVFGIIPSQGTYEFYFRRGNTVFVIPMTQISLNGWSKLPNGYSCLKEERTEDFSVTGLLIYSQDAQKAIKTAIYTIAKDMYDNRGLSMLSGTPKEQVRRILEQYKS